MVHVWHTFVIGADALPRPPGVCPCAVQFFQVIGVRDVGHTILANVVIPENSVGRDSSIEYRWEGSDNQVLAVSDETSLVASSLSLRAECYHITPFQTERADTVVQCRVGQCVHVAICVLYAKTLARLS